MLLELITHHDIGGQTLGQWPAGHDLFAGLLMSTRALHMRWPRTVNLHFKVHVRLQPCKSDFNGERHADDPSRTKKRTKKGKKRCGFFCVRARFNSKAACNLDVSSLDQKFNGDWISVDTFR